MYLLLMVTMSNYAVETYGVSISTAGLVASIFVLGSLLARLLVGKFTARFGITVSLIWKVCCYQKGMYTNLLFDLRK